MRTVAALTLAAITASALAAGELPTGTVSNSAGTRGYELHVPAGLAGEARPLLVALHGCRQTAGQFAGLTRLNELADAERILVLYPVQDATANPARCWNWFLPADQSRDGGEPSLIKAMIDEVRAKHAVDASRIYVAGLSAGGYMTSVMLACYPDVFAAAAVVSGGMYKAAESLAEGMAVPRSGSPHDAKERGERAWRCSGRSSPSAYPLLVIDGDADPIVATANGIQVVAQFAQANDYADDGKDNDSVSEPAAGARAQPDGKLAYTCREREAEGRVLMRHCTVHGLAHAWSGGDARFPYAEPKGPDATAMMWSFFATHVRSPAE